MRYVNEVTIQGSVGSCAESTVDRERTLRLAVFTETPQGNPVWHVADVPARLMGGGTPATHDGVRISGYIRQEITPAAPGMFRRNDVIEALSFERINDND